MRGGGRGGVSPALAYSITRYSVFSVSMTSKSFTAGGGGGGVSTGTHQGCPLHPTGAPPSLVGGPLTNVGVIQPLHDANFPEELHGGGAETLVDGLGHPTHCAQGLPPTLCPRQVPPTFWRLVGFSCVLSMIFMATWEGTRG